MEDNSRIGGGIQSNLSGSHPMVVGMRSRICTKSLKLLRAGGGNRTLVFSLEVGKYYSVFKGHSDRCFWPIEIITEFLVVRMANARPMVAVKTRSAPLWKSVKHWW